MYKPTLYHTMEADPEHYNPEGEGLASRLWSFTAPVTIAPSPTMELGLRARMKCAGRPYWNAADATEEANWNETAKPYLAHKLHSIIDVLNGINVKRYNHYEGQLHFTWLKLELAPLELRIRLDHDAEDNDFIPDVMELVSCVRNLINTDEYRAFAAPDESIAVYLPCRDDVKRLSSLRKQEAEAYAEWMSSKVPEKADEKEGAIGEQGDTSSEMETSQCVDSEQTSDVPAPVKPALSPGFRIATVEFVKSDGTATTWNLDTNEWSRS